MSAKHDSHGLTANPSKDAPSDRGRDGCEATQNDDTDESTNNPPNHGVPTHGVGRFLWECQKSTPVSELGERYQQWRDGTEQAEIGEWSE